VSTTEGLRLVDGDGSVLLVSKIDDLAYTLAIAPTLDEDGNPLPFRMFEEDRQKLRQFLRSLSG
jgi:hypothetical protein